MRREVSLQFTYDAEVDAAYIYLTDRIDAGGVAYSVQPDDEDLRAGINLDIDHGGAVVGIEVLGRDLLSPFLRRLIEDDSGRG